MHEIAHRASWPVKLAALVAAAVGLVLATGLPARADHSLGRPCLSCHALRSTKVVPGSRNILSDNVQDALYTTDFYCGGQWDGGEPLDCSYCHGSTGDIANEIAVSNGGTSGSAHPVDVGGDTTSYPGSIRIVCNDCHAGDTDSTTNPGADLLPTTLCTKGPGDGYPNHHSVVNGATDPGTNHLADNPPRLTAPYGPKGGATSSGGGVDWTKTTLTSSDLLCFVCHDGSPNPPYSTGITATDVASVYNQPGGGHNLSARGSLSGKLPCYDCHDPHAAAGTGVDNEALIINGVDTPVNPYGTSDFSTTGYTGANDRVVCYGCHDGTHTVEGVTPPDPASTAPVFPFHANVHANVGNSGQNCLQNNGGCHQGPHNTNFFRCLDCHSTGRDPNSAPELAGVDHVDSEFGHIGAVRGNDLLSFHTINYDTSADMSVADNNGCLKCHDTRGGPADAILKDDDGNFYTGSLGNTFSTREALKVYDPFCLSCHDGAGNDIEFTTVSSYTLTDWLNGGSQTVPAATRLPPQVNNRTGASWDQGYFFTVGHGRGNGQATTAFPWSGNPAPKIPCLECHLYHGSTAFKLLPGPKQTADGLGHVVKGYGYAVETVGTKFTIGGVSDSTEIDYTDYTDPANNPRLGNITPQRNYFRSWYISEYVNTTPWSTYHYTGSIQTPDGITTHFGTSGEMHDNTDVTSELNCGQDAQNTTSKIGFCNACHFYSQTTDGTQDTYGWVYTHEGSVGLTDCSGNDLKSQMNFFKDCAECHDPHGSGEGQDSAASPANIYMIRKKIKHAPTDSEADVKNTNWWSAVVFTATTGTDSFDEADTDNTDDLCTVCHQSSSENGNDNVSHNYRSQTLASDHQVGNNCTVCHPHGGDKGSGTTNQGLIAFGLWRTCTGCHGLPPISPCDTPGDPANELVENYPGGGGAHQKHVEFLKGKLGGTPSYEELCSPCHGANPGGASWHLESGNPAAWEWPESNQRNVDIIDGGGNFGGAALYYGGATGAAQSVKTTSNAKGGEPQQCQNLNCHGAAAPYNATPFSPTGDYSNGFSRFGASYPRSMRLLWDFTCSSYASDSNNAAGYPGANSVYDAWGRDIACAGCHGAAPGAPNTSITVGGYTSRSTLPQGVAANYFGTLSGYARGGHGDAGIQSEDPAVDSGAGVTPIHCTQCHDDTAAHFPPSGTNPHRLSFSVIEDDGHSGSALCNSCHSGASYPGKHHPSLNGPTGSNPTAHDIVPAAGQEVYGSASAWQESPAGSGHYEQDGYGAGGSSGDPDFFVDWWGGSPGDGNQSPQPAPSPFAVLPLERYVLGTGTSNRVMCVTCHNPHGTDLFTYDAFGGQQSVPDNNMLRLRDSDNTLCNACH